MTSDSNTQYRPSFSPPSSSSSSLFSSSTSSLSPPSGSSPSSISPADGESSPSFISSILSSFSGFSASSTVSRSSFSTSVLLVKLATRNRDLLKTHRRNYNGFVPHNFKKWLMQGGIRLITKVLKSHLTRHGEKIATQ